VIVIPDNVNSVVDWTVALRASSFVLDRDVKTEVTEKVQSQFNLKTLKFKLTVQQ
jgi:hypothetical protein